MNHSHFTGHNDALRNNVRSLFELSARKSDDAPQAGGVPLHALAENGAAAKLPGIDFDKVKNAWYPSSSGVNVPCSVDALRFDKDRCFMIEFKCGAAEQGNLLRKVYDSVLMLVKHDNADLEKIRRSASYIVVANILGSWRSEMRAIARSHAGFRKPWDRLAAVYDRWKLRTLEGVLVERAYSMPPDMFDYYVKFMRWK